MLPAIPGLDDILDDVPEETEETISDDKGYNMSFSTQAVQNASTNASFWNRVDKSFRPPPPPSFPRQASLADLAMESPLSGSFNQALGGHEAIPSSEGPAQPVLTKAIGKRAREEDFDPMSIKRRAVSPSLSVSNSPQVGQSPRETPSVSSQPRPERTDSWGGPPKTTRENSGDQGHVLRPHRSNSGGSVSSMAGGPSMMGPGPKRVGLQSMTDTNDGLMKMSIE